MKMSASSFSTHTIQLGLCSLSPLKPACPRPATLAKGMHQRGTGTRVQPRVQAAQSMIDALGGSSATAPRAWWEDNKELWAEVHTEQQLDAELEGHGKELVVLDFYGTWCVGCAKVYPEICRIASDGNLRQRCHFVKVCTDNMKARMKADGVRSLPYLAFHCPKHGKLLGYVHLPSRSKLVRANIEVMLQHQGAKFALDPNGYAIVTENPSTALNTEEEMEINLQEMQKEKEEMFSMPGVPVFSTMLNWVQKVTTSQD